MSYTTRGFVSGPCRHVHATLEEAAQCCARHRAQHSLSDRCVVALEGSRRVLLGVADTLAILRLSEALRPAKGSQGQPTPQAPKPSRRSRQAPAAPDRPKSRPATF